MIPERERERRDGQRSDREITSRDRKFDRKFYDSAGAALQECSRGIISRQSAEAKLVLGAAKWTRGADRL